MIITQIYHEIKQNMPNME